MEYPNFIIIGTAKAGTSSLYYYLSQHPEIYTSPIKEPNFFSYMGEKLDFKGPGDNWVTNRISITDIDDYKKLFDEVKNEIAVGEASVYYLYNKNAPYRIKKYLPQVKLIAILRNPADRAYSNFLSLRRDKREPLDTFQKALEAEEDRIKNNWEPIWHYKNTGFYYSQLSRYFHIFPTDNIAVYLYEDFRKNPLKIIRDIFCFLDVEDTFVPDLSTKANVGGYPKAQAIHDFLTKPSFIKNILKYSSSPLMRSQLKTLKNRLVLWNLKKDYSQMTMEDKRYLIDIYKEDILKVQNLIKHDLSKWLDGRKN